MRTLIAVVVLLTSAGCNLSTDTGTGPLVGNVAGTYALQTIDNKPLPFAIAAHDTTFFIDADVLTLVAGGQWSEAVTMRRVVGQTTTDASFDLVGVWGRSGNSLNLRTSISLLYVGTATDSTLNLSDAQYAYVFKR